MPEIQEVFRMATQKVRPDPEALDRQHRGQRRRVAQKRAAVYALVALLLVAGATGAAALWAAIGVGVGAVVRHQVPTVVGICAWLLFVEGLLAGDLVGLGDVFKFLPGSAAAAISGQEPGTLLAPAASLVLLGAYAAAAALGGAMATSRRDVG